MDVFCQICLQAISHITPGVRMWFSVVFKEILCCKRSMYDINLMHAMQYQYNIFKMLLSCSLYPHHPLHRKVFIVFLPLSRFKLMKNHCRQEMRIMYPLATGICMPYIWYCTSDDAVCIRFNEHRFLIPTIKVIKRCYTSSSKLKWTLKLISCLPVLTF